MLRGVNLRVERSGAAALVGRNGSGKSTLLSIAAGFLKPDAGDVLLDGRSVLADRQTARRVGFVPQGDSLFEELTVWDNVKFWAAASGVKLKSIEECPFARLLGLPAFAGKKIRDCSGGMKRRATICAGLLADPELIVLDEPFAGLDLFYKNELADRLRELTALGKTILYSTHGGDEIEGFASHVYCLNDCEIVFGTPVSELAPAGGPLNRVLLNLIRGENIE